MTFLVVVAIYGLAALLILGFVVWCVVGAIRDLYQKNKRAGRFAAWVTGALTLALCLGILLHFQPYSRLRAWLLYQRHAELFNTVAQAVWEAPEERWWEIVEESIPKELEQVKNLLWRRGGYPGAIRERWQGYRAVRFRIYSGRGVDSGDGALAYPVQYLIYCPGCPEGNGEYERSAERYSHQIAEHWYFVADFDF